MRKLSSRWARPKSRPRLRWRWRRTSASFSMSSRYVLSADDCTSFSHTNSPTSQRRSQHPDPPISSRMPSSCSSDSARSLLVWISGPGSSNIAALGTSTPRCSE
jgi:hypothetical protein